MAATFELKVGTGTNAATENSGDATNWNLLGSDAYDSTGTDYQTDQITRPASGSNFSYERWMRAYFTGTFNNVTNVKYWKSAGTLSDANLILTAGEASAGVTPVNSDSTVATAAIPTSEGTAIEITPSGGITSSGTYSDYSVVQLEVPSTVTTPGDIGVSTITFQYDED